MMDRTPAKKCRKSPKNRHIWPPFSPFFLKKCLTNSGRYILVLSQGTEENSNTICSLCKLQSAKPNTETKLKQGLRSFELGININISLPLEIHFILTQFKFYNIHSRPYI